MFFKCIRLYVFDHQLVQVAPFLSLPTSLQISAARRLDLYFRENLLIVKNHYQNHTLKRLMPLQRLWTYGVVHIFCLFVCFVLFCFVLVFYNKMTQKFYFTMKLFLQKWKAPTKKHLQSGFLRGARYWPYCTQIARYWPYCTQIARYWPYCTQIAQYWPYCTQRFGFVTLSRSVHLKYNNRKI